MSADRRLPKLEDFFAGVDRARAHLDRGSRGPRPSWERLRELAEALPKPRSLERLLEWLGESLQEALGAQAVAVWLRRDGWQRVYESGASPQWPLPPDDVQLSSAEAFTEGALWLALRGAVAPVAAVWVRGGTSVSGQTLELLLAVCDTAGLLVEQALSASELAEGSTR